MMSKRLAQLLRQAPIIDGHNDLPWQLRVRYARAVDAIDLDEDATDTGLHTDTFRLTTGGVGAQFWSVFVPCSYTGPAAVSATLEQFDVVHRLAERYPRRLELAYTAADVVAAQASGRVASLMGVEGGHSIDGSLAVLRMFHALGARYLTLTHNLNTPWADSATDTPVLGGLSDFGRDVVRECNRLGIMADLSHTAPATMHGTLDVSTAPAFFSHSSARALCDHPRNVPDDVLTRVRDTDGLVMVTFVPGFLTESCRAWFGELTAAEAEFSARWAADSLDWYAGQRRWIAEHPPPPTSAKDVADHLEHVREVAGVDSVGLGGDFDGVCVLPDGLGGVDSYHVLLQELVSRKWSDADIGKLTWHNALRVLRDTEAAARAARRPGGVVPAPPPLSAEMTTRLERFDLDGVADALADNAYEHHYFLDPTSGQTELWFEEMDADWDEDVDDHYADWIPIDGIPPRVWYEDMVDFAEQVSDSRTRRVLDRALDGKGAFRRFRDAVHDERINVEWYAFSRNRAIIRAVEWLHENELIDEATMLAHRAAHPDPAVP